MKYFLALVYSLLLHSVCSANEVIYIWSGGLTDSSINIHAKLTDSSSAVRLMLSTSPGFTAPLFSGFYQVDSSTNMMVAMTISGLAPGTKYYYGVESDGIADTSADDAGSFTTLSSGHFSFYFAIASCCFNSDHVVYDVMRNSQPLFFTCMGDLHYGDPNSATDINVHRNMYESQVLSKPAAAAFFKEVPIDYVWDDHDFSGNNSDSTSAGKANARQAYREYVPHYPLAAGNGNAAIYHSFTIGRVRFILTDLRSDRYGNSMLGAQQKIWFKNECVAARDSQQIIAWISTTTWNGTQPDNWGGYPAERTELANFFRDSLIENMFIICGDAHMLGIDDGTHGDFSTVLFNPSPYPIFNAAALNQNGSYKGGTFSEGGAFLNPSYLYGQFGLVQIIDTGGSVICIRFFGYRTDVNGDDILLMDQYSFCRGIGSSPSGLNTVQNFSASSMLYPNPSRGIFVMETAEQLNHPEIKIYDLAGREMPADYEYSISGEHISFTLDNFSAGIYFVNVKTENSVYRKQFVIVK
ncbi:MAG: alkaline phosphatase D family protein [Bacteroidota bacterium]|nr:alkaline phosphatase D family protein [Bacteroidota bacterium]